MAARVLHGQARDLAMVIDRNPAEAMASAEG
jgi:hypothetical protein